MNKQSAKQAIIDCITDVQGCKATELICKERLASVVTQFNMVELLQELVNEKQIIEVAYVLPSMSYREKSFYLPSGTETKISTQSSDVQETFWLVLYDGFPSERVCIVKAISQEIAINKLHEDLDLILREEFHTDEEFKAEVDLEEVHKNRRFTIHSCAFNQNGIITAYER